MSSGLSTETNLFQTFAIEASAHFDNSIILEDMLSTMHLGEQSTSCTRTSKFSDRGLITKLLT